MHKSCAAKPLRAIAMYPQKTICKTQVIARLISQQISILWPQLARSFFLAESKWGLGVLTYSENVDWGFKNGLCHNPINNFPNNPFFSCPLFAFPKRQAAITTSRLKKRYAPRPIGSVGREHGRDAALSAHLRPDLGFGNVCFPGRLIFKMVPRKVANFDLWIGIGVFCANPILASRLMGVAFVEGTLVWVVLQGKNNDHTYVWAPDNRICKGF